VLTLLTFLLAGATAGFVVGYLRGRRSPEPELPYVPNAPPTAWAEDATFRRMASSDL
jgi:hypothetical protein